MHSPLIRFASLLLALLMLLSLAACGTGEQTPDGESDGSGSVTDALTEAETPDPNYTLDLEEGLNYDTDVVILYVNKTGRTDELECEKLGGGVISDAVYERNVAVEERLGSSSTTPPRTTIPRSSPPSPTWSRQATRPWISSPWAPICA